MSDTPVIFKRSKVKANQRAREEPQQDAQEQRVQSTEDEPSPSAVASKIRNKAKQRVKPKTLSFGVEEEVSQHDTSSLIPDRRSQEGNEEVFAIKKSSLSQKLSLRQHPAPQGCVCCPTLSENFMLNVCNESGRFHPTWTKPAYLPVRLGGLSTTKPT